MHFKFTLAVCSGLMLSACAARDNNDLAAMLSGQSRMKGNTLTRTINAAAAYPLGSDKNPVRAEGPVGQRAYLSRLRCADGNAPAFDRAGSAGLSPFGNIVDIYSVECLGGTPSKGEIWMDMYHSGYVEQTAVPGYVLIEPRH
ncbi:hypothetical protein [Sphingomonas sp.]